MNTFFKLTFFACCFGQITPAIANFQSHISQQKNEVRQIKKKAYVPLDKLHFSEEGIFFNCKEDLWTRVEQLGFDSQGYYVAARVFRQRHYVAKCNNCDEEYLNRCPQPCEACNKADGFDLIYIEDGPWD